MVHVLSSIVRGVAQFFEILGAASRAAAALEACRQPHKDDLLRLGMSDLPQFRV